MADGDYTLQFSRFPHLLCGRHKSVRLVDHQPLISNSFIFPNRKDSHSAYPGN